MKSCPPRLKSVEVSAGVTIANRVYLASASRSLSLLISTSALPVTARCRNGRSNGSRHAGMAGDAWVCRTFRGHSPGKSTRFLENKVQVGTKQKRATALANTCSWLRHRSFNQTLLASRIVRSPIRFLIVAASLQESTPPQPSPAVAREGLTSRGGSLTRREEPQRITTLSRARPDGCPCWRCSARRAGHARAVRSREVPWL